METGVKLACIPQAAAQAPAVAALEAIHTRQLRPILRRPEGHSQVHIKDRRPLEQIVSRTSHAQRLRRNVPILRLSVRMRSRRGRT